MDFGRPLTRAWTNSRDDDSAFGATARWVDTDGRTNQTRRLVYPSVIELHDRPQRAGHLLQVLSHDLLPV